MATFTILVTHAPFDQQKAQTAHDFVRACNQAGHTVAGVFFYQAGVLNGNAFQAGHSDEVNMYRQWCDLAEQGIPLQVCVTAANRRGIINETDAEELDEKHFNLRQPFDEVGLGELMALMHESDRTVQF